jgi:hypothetical protein
MKRICYNFEPDYPEMNERSGCRKYVDERFENHCFECGQGIEIELMAAHCEHDDTGQDEKGAT